MGPFVPGNAALAEPVPPERQGLGGHGPNSGPPSSAARGEARGEGPWLTNLLFCAFQAAASARGEALAQAYDLAPNED